MLEARVDVGLSSRQEWRQLAMGRVKELLARQVEYGDVTRERELAERGRCVGQSMKSGVALTPVRAGDGVVMCEYRNLPFGWKLIAPAMGADANRDSWSVVDADGRRWMFVRGAQVLDVGEMLHRFAEAARAGIGSHSLPDAGDI